jgi:hypothetical protein
VVSLGGAHGQGRGPDHRRGARGDAGSESEMLMTGRHQMQNANNAEMQKCIRASLHSCIVGIDALLRLDFAV